MCRMTVGNTVSTGTDLINQNMNIPPWVVSPIHPIEHTGLSVCLESYPQQKLIIIKTSAPCVDLQVITVYTKHRISEPQRGIDFLKATNYFKDDVYTRTCDITDYKTLFAADVYVHKVCVNGYIKKYKDSINKPEPTVENSSPIDKRWNDVVPSILESLARAMH